MTHTPTPEEFLAQTDVDEDTEETTAPIAASPNAIRRAMGLPESAETVGTGGALDSIARSMEALVSLVQRLDAQAADADALSENMAALQVEYDALDTAYTKLEGQLAEVLEVCKPSTSKLANSIRAVLQPAAEVPTTEAPADDTTVDLQPANDAPVEEWREYARSRGFEVLDTMNRSQIRTQLGIAQPVS